jgi:hypothetical protein
MHHDLTRRNRVRAALGLTWCSSLPLRRWRRKAAPIAPERAATASRSRAAGLPTPPEVIGAIGRFIDQSITNVGAGVKGARRNARRSDQRGRRSRQGT